MTDRKATDPADVEGVDRDAAIARHPVDRKAALTSGSDMWRVPGDPVLGLLPITVSDGPNGVRGSRMDERFTGYCTPCGTSLAASWDTTMIRAVGRLVARDARRQGVHVVLGPTVNLHRSPLGGRGFECYSEDPVLTGAVAVAWMRGLQSLGIAATPKHFVANDSETSRRSVDVEVDERALRELYLAPFESLARAGAWAVMTAYNKVNGTYAAAHPHLIRDVLKGEWGWDGLVMSDWFGASDTIASAQGGLDLEMPGPARSFGAALGEAVADGSVPEALLDDKVRRLLRLGDRVGRTVGRHGPADVASDGSLAVDLPDELGEGSERALLRHAAVRGMVLLRNDFAVLPLQLAPGTRLAVIGPHAQDPCYQGGGSARLSISRPSEPLTAIRARFPDAEITYEPGCVVRDALPLLHTLGVRPTHVDDAPEGSLTVEYFDAEAPGSEPYLVETRYTGKLAWLGDFPVPPSGPGLTRVKVSARFWAPVAGCYQFSVRGSEKVIGKVDGHELVCPADREYESDVFSLLFGNDEERIEVDLPAGQHLIELAMVVEPAPLVAMHLRAQAPIAPDLFERAVRAAQDAEMAIVLIGTTDEIESESTDRTTVALPGRQSELVRAVAAVNPRTVVVVNAGMPVDVSWATEVAAVVYAWFPGQEFGAALADVLDGSCEPGGRLPMSIARSAEDYPAYRIEPGSPARLRYEESLFIGYRHFDEHGIEPAYPFGHGLGYTDWDYESLTVTSDGGGTGPITVDVRVRNAGDRPGREVVQLYVAAVDPVTPRAPQELAAFGSVELGPGERADVTLTVVPRRFAYWSTGDHLWRQDPGEYEVRVGRSSRDIRLRTHVQRADDRYLHPPQHTAEHTDDTTGADL